MWGAILSGGLSLLGGLGARQSAKSAQRQADARAEQSRLQNAWTSAEMLDQVPKRIAGDAETAGFNPVTWLQGGALGYYTNAYQMRMTSPGQTVQVPSMLSAFADAGSAALNAFRSDARYEDTKAFQSSQLDKQLASRAAIGQRSVELRPGQSALGLGTTYAASRAVSGPGTTVGGGLSISSVDPWSGKKYMGTPSADDVETFGGEAGGFVQGLYNMGNAGWQRAFPNQGTWAETLRRGMSNNPVAKAVQTIYGAEWNNPFRNPYDTSPRYRTGGGFGGGDWSPFGTAGGF